MILCGCGGDKNSVNIKDAYLSMTTQYVIEEKNFFFSNSLKPNSIVIDYADNVDLAINSPDLSNDVQKRYKALDYQQKILNNIFDYYHNHQEEFYTKASSANKDDLNTLYNKVTNLKNKLKDFESHFERFEDATTESPFAIMEYHITSYSFELNKIIDASFDFIDYFHELYVKYCIEDYSIYNAKNIHVYVDKAYIDIARIVYMENIKSFNETVGSNGVCDMSTVVGSDNEYNILNVLDNKGTVSVNVLDNLGADNELGREVLQNLNEFTYIRDVFEQRLETYKTNYSKIDKKFVSQYKFDEMAEFDYDSYLKTLSASDRATLVMIDNFVSQNFVDMVVKLDKIVD